MQLLKTLLFSCGKTGVRKKVIKTRAQRERNACSQITKRGTTIFQNKTKLTK